MPPIDLDNTPATLAEALAELTEARRALRQASKYLSAEGAGIHFDTPSGISGYMCPDTAAPDLHAYLKALVS